MENIFMPTELEHMEVIFTVASPLIEGLGVMILGEHTHGNGGLPTIRIYLMRNNNETDIYEIEKELEAFSFLTLHSALEFVKSFPHMSALDLILAMNSLESV
ncbi:hypothetical protein [Psychrobacillus sp. NPDC096623]|uniref:hypothetical protein n=1 Tax=Psychrobacillus sp. NPDC096623 TaxID=3364492 RepID=UPI0038272D19